MNIRFDRFALFALALGTMAGVEAAELKGSVTYLQRIALPSDAKVTVTLEDVSLADAPAKTLARTEFESAGKQVPLPFTLTFDESQVKQGHRYAVRASIHQGGRLTWTTDTSYFVKLDGSDGEVSVRVVQVPAGKPAPSLPETIELGNVKWTLYELEGAPVQRVQWTPHFTFDVESGSFGGRGGVNNMGGTFKREGFGMTFGPVRSTMMAGPQQQMDMEQRISGLFPRVTTAKIFGDKLVWYASGVPVAKFFAEPKDR